jgi:hypothetical protein
MRSHWAVKFRTPLPTCDICFWQMEPRNFREPNFWEKNHFFGKVSHSVWECRTPKPKCDIGSQGSKKGSSLTFQHSSPFTPSDNWDWKLIRLTWLKALDDSIESFGGYCTGAFWVLSMTADEAEIVLDEGWRRGQGWTPSTTNPSNLNSGAVKLR